MCFMNTLSRYGDICPQTRPGKVFSICWVMSGVACCALFTSYITTILTSACLSEDATLYGTKVGADTYSVKDLMKSFFC